MSDHWNLLVGQSNMAAQGMWGNPFTKRSNAFLYESHNNEFVGPGAAYVNMRAQDAPSLNIKALMAAIGGTSMDQWAPGGSCFASMLALWEAYGYPSIERILFMQGEYEGLSGNLTLADAWESKFNSFKDAVRSAEVFGNIPIIVAAIGPNPGSPNTNGVFEAWQSVQRQQENLDITNVAVVASKDLAVTEEGGVHFTKDAYWTIGGRMYGTNL